MKHDVAMVWVKDLRESGAKQAKKVLYDGTGYCCLGRLCIVLGNTFEYRTDTYFVKNTESYAVLPNHVMEEAGMQSRSGTNMKKFAEASGESWDLANLNDEGYSFAEIAGLIEKHWADL